MNVEKKTDFWDTFVSTPEYVQDLDLDVLDSIKDDLINSSSGIWTDLRVFYHTNDIEINNMQEDTFLFFYDCLKYQIANNIL